MKNLLEFLYEDWTGGLDVFLVCEKCKTEIYPRHSESNKTFLLRDYTAYCIKCNKKLKLGFGGGG